jgi:hypothetical protein
MGVPIASLLKELSGGDLRSSGRANHIVARVAREPALFRQLFRGLSSRDRIVRMRAADAIEKITVDRPELLLPYKRDLLELAASSGEKEFRWHMALLLPRLKLRVSGRRRWTFCMNIWATARVSSGHARCKAWPILPAKM